MDEGILLVRLRRVHEHHHDEDRGGRPAAGAPAGGGEPRTGVVEPGSAEEGSFIDDRLRDSESDLPYAVRRTADGGAAWLGRLEGQIAAIENLLRAGAPWPLIESATGIDQAALRALKQRLETSSTTTEPTEGSANGAEDTE